MAAATEAFIASGGFQKTAVADIARALGAAKGTVYLYAESKEALFHLALLHADGPPPSEPTQLPAKTPSPGETEALLSAMIESHGHFDLLRQAIDAPGQDPREEAVRVIKELYDRLAAHRTAIRLVNSSARDLPELARVWYERARHPLEGALATWVGNGMASGRFVPLPDAAAAARVLLESATWFAVHRHWDPRPQPFDATAARATVVQMLTHALLP